MGFTSNDIPSPTDTKDLIDPKTPSSQNTSGFQRAHIVGEDFASRDPLGWFRWLLGPREQNSRVNGVLAPQRQRGGAILGVAVHLSNHVPEFDRLFFDESQAGLDSSSKWMNVVRRDLLEDLKGVLGDEIDLGKSNPLVDVDRADPRVANILSDYNRRTAAFLDFTKIQFLHADQLEKLNHDGLRSLALNAQDLRYETNGDVSTYLRGLDADGFLDFDNVEDNGLFKEIVELRDGMYAEGLDPDSKSGRAEFERRMIERHPVLSRIFYPDGKVLWPDAERANILARDAIMGGVSDADGKVDYDRLRQVLNSGKFAEIEAEIQRGLSRIPEADRARIHGFTDFANRSAELDPERWGASAAKIIAAMDDPEIDAFRNASPEFLETKQQLVDYAKRVEVDADGRARIRGLDIDLNLGSRAAGALGNVLFGWAKYEVAKAKYGEGSEELKQWVINEAISIAIGVPIGAAAAWLAAAAGPLGTVALISAGAYFGYQEIKELATDAKEAFPADSFQYKLADTVLDFMDAFEATIKPYVDSIKAVVAEFYNQVIDPLIPTIQFVEDGAVGFALEPNTWMIGSDEATLIGLDDEENGDVQFHSGSGEVKGLKGDDILVGWFSGTGEDGEGLLLDGGAGNDWVISILGEKAVTVGGVGRDWVFNTSLAGELYGDTISGTYESGDGVKKVEDVSENADSFWYFPDTVIMDAQHFDVLKFFGVPLTGGDAAASGVALALGAVSGSITVAGGSIAAFNAAAAATGNAVYFDHLLPFITYKRDGDDLLVANVFDGFFRAVTGRDGIFEIEAGNEKLDVKGVQRIRNFDFVSSTWGFQQVGLSAFNKDDGRPQGTMNMVFKDGNPYLLPLFLITTLPSVAGSGAFGFLLQALITLDASLITISAMLRAAKSARWASGGDPLILDLDGDGIETVAMDRGSIYFDGDANRFSERTGWVKGDDGFLVLDENGNGRVDDGTELFGGLNMGGLEELA